MTSYPFLSKAWIEAAEKVHQDVADRIVVPHEIVRMNITVVDVPLDGPDRLLGHIDTTDGSAIPRDGHIDGPDVAVTILYQLARRLVVGQHLDELMIAFMSGEVEVEGDVTMIVALQDAEPTPEQQALAEEVADRLAAITAD